MRKRVSGIFVSVLVTVFTFCILCTVFDGRKVNADPGMWCSSNPWDIGSDEYEFNFGFWGAQNGDTVNFTITFDASEVFVTESGSVFNVTENGNSISGSVTYDSSVSQYVMHVRVMTTSLSIDSYSVTSVVTSAPPPPPPPTNPPPAPGTGPGPGPAPTAPTTPTAATTTARPTSATTAATASATTTTKPASEAGGAPATTTTTTAPAVAGGEATSPAQPDTTTAVVTETIVSESSDASDTSEETSEEISEETSEETSIERDVPTTPASEMAGAAETTEETAPPTPTTIPRLYDASVKKTAFPWWIVILGIATLVIALRYRKLAAQDLYMDEIIYEFIPGRVIGKIADKIRPPKETAPAAPVEEEEKPKVINGYLQTSNTRVIRPEFSNAAALKAAEEAKKKASGELPGIKPPVKRPKSASVDHASAGTSVSEDKSVDLTDANGSGSDDTMI